MFRSPDHAIVEEFARDDPYVTNGFVTRWEIRSWAVVIGQEGPDSVPQGGQ